MGRALLFAAAVCLALSLLILLGFDAVPGTANEWLTGGLLSYVLAQIEWGRGA